MINNKRYEQTQPYPDLAGLNFWIRRGLQPHANHYMRSKNLGVTNLTAHDGICAKWACAKQGEGVHLHLKIINELLVTKSKHLRI